MKRRARHFSTPVVYLLVLGSGTLKGTLESSAWTLYWEVHCHHLSHLLVLEVTSIEQVACKVRKHTHTSSVRFISYTVFVVIGSEP